MADLIPEPGTGAQIGLPGAEAEHAMAAPARRSYREILYFLLLTIFAFILYAQIFLYDSIGPEFPLFFFYNHNLPFGQMLRAYLGFDQMWYRPTSFALFYWIGDQFFSWHNLHAWRAFHLLTVIAVAYAIYRLTLELFPGRKVAGVLAGMFFLAHPSLFPFVYQVAPFDFPYIGLSVMCAVFYLRGFRREGSAGVRATLVSWIFFVLALTAKEASLAVPGFLGVASLILIWGETDHSNLGKRLWRECLRLLPFAVMLPLYWLVHMKQVSQTTFSAEGGPYRAIVDLNAILENLRTLPLWTFRLYFFTGKTLDQTMYHSTLINNAAGLAMLGGVALQWLRKTRAEPGIRHLALLLAAWIAMFLLLPVYAGGYLWHVNLSVAGYAVLFGMAASWFLDGLKDERKARGGVGLIAVGLLALGWSNLKVELHQGTHSIGFQIAEKLLKSPPVAPEKLPPSPVIAFEDRLGLGPWWYGCYGRLFNYVYLRHDIEEVLIPPGGPIPERLRAGTVDPSRVFLFRYDKEFQWHDASDELRNPMGLTPSLAEIRPGETQRFTMRDSRGVSWSISTPDFGEIREGVYTAPKTMAAPRTVTVTAASSTNANVFSRANVTVAQAWESASIGEPKAEGRHAFENGVHLVTGTGDVFGKVDRFQFVHQPMEGDGVIVARINKAPGKRAKAGLMFRESLAAGSAHVFSAVFGDGVSLLEVRPGEGAETTATFGAPKSHWVALARKGDLFTAFASTDGSVWTRVGTPQRVTLGRKLQAGFAVSSGNEPALTIGFDQLRFQRTAGIAGPGEAQFAPIRINAGGASLIDAEGRSWRADEGASGGSIAVLPPKVTGTKDPALYATERWHSGPFHYQFAVPNGRYRVTLKFAELYFQKAGERSFSVTINGRKVLTDFDIVREAGGPNRALDREFEADVADELLTIEFGPGVSNPKVNGVEVEGRR